MTQNSAIHFIQNADVRISCTDDGQETFQVDGHDEHTDN